MSRYQLPSTGLNIFIFALPSTLKTFIGQHITLAKRVYDALFA